MTPRGPATPSSTAAMNRSRAGRGSMSDGAKLDPHAVRSVTVAADALVAAIALVEGRYRLSPHRGLWCRRQIGPRRHRIEELADDQQAHEKACPLFASGRSQQARKHTVPELCGGDHRIS